MSELVGLGHAVGTQALCQILGMCHRFDALRVDGLHLFDQGKNLVQVAERATRLGVADFDSGEVGDAVDLFYGKRDSYEITKVLNEGAI